MTSAVDAVDASTADGICATAGMVCTLRAAIQQADALGGANTINVPAGLHGLTLGRLTTNNPGNTLTIRGTGAPDAVIVDGGGVAGVFAFNQGPGTATGCELFPVEDLPAGFGYQTTDPATNQLRGTPNTPASIVAGAQLSFVFALTPTAPVQSADARFTFVCADADPAPIVVGLNSLLFSASASAVADIIALVATPTADGIVTLGPAAPSVAGLAAPTAGFAVATVNVGAVGDLITVSARSGNAALALGFALCQTDSAMGACVSAVGLAVPVQIAPNATPTFAVFASAGQPIPFDPAGSRIFVIFEGSDGQVHGSTSVAVRTPWQAASGQKPERVGAMTMSRTQMCAGRR